MTYSLIGVYIYDLHYSLIGVYTYDVHYSLIGVYTHDVHYSLHLWPSACRVISNDIVTKDTLLVSFCDARTVGSFC